MTSATRDSKDGLTDSSSSSCLQFDKEVHRHDGASATSKEKEKNKSRNRESRQRQQEGAKSAATKPSACRSDLQSAVELPLSSSTEPRARSAVQKALPEHAELASMDGVETAGGREQAVYGPKTELAPARRSRSRDRRLSMSIIDTVFRRRRRRSLASRLQESSDSELSPDVPANTANDPSSTTDRPGVWKSDTCRHLSEETSSTAELDEVDHHPRPLTSFWQHKIRRRIHDISHFNKPNDSGMARRV